MKGRLLISPGCLQPASDLFLRKILRRCGSYYHSADLFYHELWKQRLVQIGFRVISVEKLDLHDVWDIRLCMKLASQTYLLLSKPVPKQHGSDTRLLIMQLRSEIRAIAKELGRPISRDAITVARTGAYFQISFIWPLGKPGRSLKQEKQPDAFSFLIRPWLRRSRN